MFLLRRALGLVTTPPAPRRVDESPHDAPASEFDGEPDPTTEEIPRED